MSRQRFGGVLGGVLGAMPRAAAPAIAAPMAPATMLDRPAAIWQDRRWFRHRGVLKLHCSECRYVMKRWHVPILAVDCNANPRHKQALTSPSIRSRWSAQFPEYLIPYVEGKQYERRPRYRMEMTFQTYHSKKKFLRLR
mmetsp:Transcript_19108/g.44080  ORF Transcript_19108/g.44080 Transcript_19108/m.44080 type:complete len:139 (-) Transcript_19108:86-502(-)